MWILPADLGTIALPEGVLLLPHHYGAEDRERLLALLRVALPGCRQLVVEGAALAGLMERGVRWDGGLVLVHGLAEDTEVDGLRGLVAPLGAKHVLVQLPQAQLVGTSWMEPTLKVPVLKALERAWRDPAHPLRGIGIHECPLREAAQYTDEPVELMAIVTAMVEHRMVNASVGVGRTDWERSLDHALALRLRARWPTRLSETAVGCLIAGQRPCDQDVHELEGCGLGIEDRERFRTRPLLSALERPTVRAFVMPFSQSFSERKSPMIGAVAVVEYEHMTRELWPSHEFAQFEQSMPSTVYRALGIQIGELSLGLYQPHIELELSDRRRERFGTAIASLHVAARAAVGTARSTLIAQGAFLRGISADGRDASALMEEALRDLEKTRIRARWWPEAVSTLAQTWALRTWIHRKSRADVRAILSRLNGLKDLLHEPSAPDRLQRVYRRVAFAQRDRSTRSLTQNHQAARVLVDGVANSDEPDVAWMHLLDGDVHRVVQQAGNIGASSTTKTTTEHLQADLVVGIASLSLGDLDAGSQRGSQVLDLATRYEIPVLRAFARELLAAVHELRGEYDFAARLLFQARSRYIALEDTARIVGVEKRLARMGITYDPFGSPRRKRAPRSS